MGSLVKVVKVCFANAHVVKPFTGEVVNKRSVRALIANIARTKRRRTKSFGTRFSFTLYNRISPANFSFSG